MQSNSPRKNKLKTIIAVKLKQKIRLDSIWLVILSTICTTIIIGLSVPAFIAIIVKNINTIQQKEARLITESGWSPKWLKLADENGQTVATYSLENVDFANKKLVVSATKNSSQQEEKIAQINIYDIIVGLDYILDDFRTKVAQGVYEDEIHSDITSNIFVDPHSFYQDLAKMETKLDIKTGTGLGGEIDNPYNETIGNTSAIVGIVITGDGVSVKVDGLEKEVFSWDDIEDALNSFWDWITGNDSNSNSNQNTNSNENENSNINSSVGGGSLRCLIITCDKLGLAYIVNAFDVLNSEVKIIGTIDENDKNDGLEIDLLEYNLDTDKIRANLINVESVTQPRSIFEKVDISNYLQSRFQNWDEFIEKEKELEVNIHN